MSVTTAASFAKLELQVQSGKVIEFECASMSKLKEMTDIAKHFVLFGLCLGYTINYQPQHGKMIRDLMK